MTTLLASMLLTIGAAAQVKEELKVNAEEWNALQPQDRKNIEDILDTSNLAPAGVKIVPTREEPKIGDVPQAAGLGDFLKKHKKWICERGCEVGGVGATAGCGVIAGGPAAAVCAALADKALPLCKEKC